VIDIDKIENEDEIVDLDNNNEHEVPSDMNTQEYLYNEKASDDANFSSNLLSSDVTSEQQKLHALDIMKFLDRNIVEAAGDANKWNQNDNDNQNGNGYQGTDESEGMEATTDSDNIDRWPEYCDPNYRMPGMITVRVTLDLEERRFQVNIVKAVKCSKIYLGKPSFLPLFVSFPPFVPSLSSLYSMLCDLFLFACFLSQFSFYFPNFSKNKFNSNVCYCTDYYTLRPLNNFFFIP
jgi:hypothetical protein